MDVGCKIGIIKKKKLSSRDFGTYCACIVILKLCIHILSVVASDETFLYENWVKKIIQVIATTGTDFEGLQVKNSIKWCFILANIALYSILSGSTLFAKL